MAMGEAHLCKKCINLVDKGGQGTEVTLLHARDSLDKKAFDRAKQGYNFVYHLLLEDGCKDCAKAVKREKDINI